MGVLALGWSGLSTGCGHVGTGRGSWDGAIPAPGWGFWCSQGWGTGGVPAVGRGGSQHRRIAPWRAAAAPWESLLSEHSPNGVAPLVPTPARPPARGNGRPGAARCRFGWGEGGRGQSVPSRPHCRRRWRRFLPEEAEPPEPKQSERDWNKHRGGRGPAAPGGTHRGASPPPTTTPHPSP